jgi:hypothetical protein
MDHKQTYNFIDVSSPWCGTRYLRGDEYRSRAIAVPDAKSGESGCWTERVCYLSIRGQGFF